MVVSDRGTILFIFPCCFNYTIANYKEISKYYIDFWIISLLSLMLMIVISQPHLNHSRVYFGTDTRLQTLLLGVILAFLWPPFKLKAEPPKVLQRAIDGVGFIGLAF